MIVSTMERFASISMLLGSSTCPPTSPRPSSGSGSSCRGSSTPYVSRRAPRCRLEGDGLVLVHVGRRPDHAGVEPMRRQRRGCGEVFGQTVPDHKGAEEGLHDSIALGFTT